MPAFLFRTVGNQSPANTSPRNSRKQTPKLKTQRSISKKELESNRNKHFGAKELISKKYKFEKPELKQHSYVRTYAGRNAIHESDRERAGSIVHNLYYDKHDPEIRDNPIFMRKK